MKKRTRWGQPSGEGQGLEEVNRVNSDHSKNDSATIAPAPILEMANRAEPYLVWLVWDPPILIDPVGFLPWEVNQRLGGCSVFSSFNVLPHLVLLS